MSEHALLSASGAHRWLECTPSARLEENLPKTVSTYAQEGTKAHQVATDLLLDKQVECDADMLNHCKQYVEYVKSKEAEMRLIETKVEFSDWVPEGFGTADCLIFNGNELEVIDFKYGQGKCVSAHENPQMKLYALGAYSTYGLLFDIETLTMTIYQPRISDKPNSYKTDIKTLLDWGENYVKPRANLAYLGDGEYKPSKSVCQFCKAKSTCRARIEHNVRLFNKKPINAQEAGEILKQLDKSFIADLEKLVLDALINGEEIAGWQLKLGRQMRVFSDIGKVAKALEAAGLTDIYKHKELLSLGQLEKKFGKQVINEMLAGLITKTKGHLGLERSG